MLKNYIKTALRNLSRNKLYSFLNITGLAIGMACCFMIFFYVQDELSFDRFHEKADRIFRVTSHFVIQDRDMDFASSAHVQGPMFKDEYPEVEDYVRFNSFGSRRIIRYEEKMFTEEKFIWVDNSVFNVFSFNLIKGNREDVLTKPNTVVITEDMAEKYFGDEDPVGKNLLVHGDTLYLITGVVENIPKNSHVRPDFLASFSTLELEPTGNAAQDLVSNVDYYTYLLLREGADYKALERKFVGFVDKYLAPVIKSIAGTAEYGLQPLTSIYLYSDKENELDRTSDISYIYLFSAIGLFILLLACLNFMNLSTARSANRAKEVGLRKVVGANRGQLIKQFLGESMILTFIAVLLAVVLVYASMQIFNQISGKEMSRDVIFNPVLLLGLFGLFIVIGIIGGSYPAFFLSAFHPAEVLYGRLKRGAKSSLLRIVLVSLQFTVSIVLIIGTLLVNKQLNYVRNHRLGYDKDHVIALRIRNEDTQKKSRTIKQELLQHPNVLKVSASSSLPLGQNSFSAFQPGGKPMTEMSMFFTQIVDEDFLDTYNIELVQGRNFSLEFSTDPQEAIIINQVAVDKMGWQDNPLGKEINAFMSLTERKGYRIIGVVSDYHFQSLHEEIQPLILFNASPYGGDYYRISIRVKPENIQETVVFIKSKWGEFDSLYPLEYVFVDDQYDALYRTEERLGKLVGYFTILAIIIGCLGLFGLSSYSAEQRTKEIGIRKVLGASIPGIVFLLVREFTKWVFLAVVIAWPIGYFAMKAWLRNFAYRINLGVDTFIGAALLALVIAVLTVTFQAARAAMTNPVNSLKYE